jgi:hypothetical protein
MGNKNIGIMGCTFGKSESSVSFAAKEFSLK